MLYGLRRGPATVQAGYGADLHATGAPYRAGGGGGAGRSTCVHREAVVARIEWNPAPRTRSAPPRAKCADRLQHAFSSRLADFERADRFREDRARALAQR